MVATSALHGNGVHGLLPAVVGPVALLPVLLAAAFAHLFAFGVPVPAPLAARSFVAAFCIRFPPVILD